MSLRQAPRKTYAVFLLGINLFLLLRHKGYNKNHHLAHSFPKVHIWVGHVLAFQEAKIDRMDLFRTRLFIGPLPSRDRGERGGGAALCALRGTLRREEGWRPIVAPVRLRLRRETARGSSSGKAVKPVIAAARVPIRQPVPHRWCR
jgi:hypothetical protein